jgi:ubiquitin-conjugating enzyme E2 J1
MQGNTAIKRLTKEFKLYKKTLDEQLVDDAKFTDNFILAHDAENIQVWYFVIFGLKGAYNGGVYLGQINFKDDFPHSAPDVKFWNDTGRFITNMFICLSITSHHQDEWNPLWNVRTIVTGLISLMDLERTAFHGWINIPTAINVKEIAAKSKAKMITSTVFSTYFSQFEGLLKIDRVKLAEKKKVTVEDN